MTWLIVAFAVGGLVGSLFPAFRWDRALLAQFFTRSEADQNPWDSRFW